MFRRSCALRPVLDPAVELHSCHYPSPVHPSDIADSLTFLGSFKKPIKGISVGLLEDFLHFTGMPEYLQNRGSGKRSWRIPRREAQRMTGFELSTVFARKRRGDWIVQEKEPLSSFKRTVEVVVFGVRRCMGAWQIRHQVWHWGI